MSISRPVEKFIDDLMNARAKTLNEAERESFADQGAKARMAGSVLKQHGDGPVVRRIMGTRVQKVLKTSAPEALVP